MENRPEQESIEARLRQTAPELSPDLRFRVLRRCQETRRPRFRFAWSRQWSFACVLMGFVLLCSSASLWLDAKSQAILLGTDRNPAGIEQAVRQENRVQPGAETQSLLAALRWRLQQVALLLQEKRSG